MSNLVTIVLVLSRFRERTQAILVAIGHCAPTFFAVPAPSPP